MPRAGVILIQDHSIALIARHRGGVHYYVFPGGHAESGETAPQTAIREAYEELGLNVEITSSVIRAHYKGEVQHYYRVQAISGIFGKGNGPEMNGLYPQESGTYHAVWMAVEDLLCYDVRPKPLAEWLQKNCNRDWPKIPIDLPEG